MEILEKRFKVIKRLGSGSFGEIYKVQKVKNGEMFAAKVERASKS
jgi:serine/threonine protein kinase